MHRIALVLVMAVLGALAGVPPVAHAADSAAPDLSAPWLHFGEARVSTTTDSQTITVRAPAAGTVDGTASIAGQDSADFVRTGGTCSWPSVWVPPGGSCTVTLAFSPRAAGERRGELRIAYGTTASTVALSGAGVATTSATARPSVWPGSLDLGRSTSGTTGPASTLTVSNSGGTPYSARGSFTGTHPGDFVRTGGTCPWPTVSVQADDSCTVVVAFRPTAAGGRTAQLHLDSNQGDRTATLTGTGLTPADPAVTPATTTFDPVSVGRTTVARTITVNNAGETEYRATASFAGSHPDDFLHTGGSCSWPTVVVPGQGSCTVEMAFQPTRVGDRSAQLHLSSGQGDRTVALAGTGLVEVGTSELDFDSEPHGSETPPKQLMVANPGSSPFSGEGRLTGPHAADYRVSGCGWPDVTIGADSSCKLSVVFAPSTGWAYRTATIELVSPAGHSVNVNLQGLAAYSGLPHAAVDSITFGSVTVGDGSPKQVLTLHNQVGDSQWRETYFRMSFGGTHPNDFRRTGGTCPWPAGELFAASCTVEIEHRPSAPGNRTAEFAVEVNWQDGAEPEHRSDTVTLSGLGVATPPAPVATPTALVHPDVRVGETGTARTVTVSNTGGSVYAATGGLIGAGAGDFVRTGGTCHWPVVTVPAHGECTIDVAFVPTTTGERSATLLLDSADGDVEVPMSGNALAPPPTDETRPTVRITKLRLKQRTARVSFTGKDESGSPVRFRCQVDGRRAKQCESPFVVRKLRPGRHMVRVWSVDAAGNKSLPAVKRFRIRH